MKRASSLSTTSRPSKSMRMSVSRNTMTLGGTLGKTSTIMKETRNLQDKQLQKAYMDIVRDLLTKLDYYDR